MLLVMTMGLQKAVSKLPIVITLITAMLGIEQVFSYHKKSAVLHDIGGEPFTGPLLMLNSFQFDLRRFSWTW